MPSLSILDLSRNTLDAKLPVEVNLAPKLATLDLERSGIRGTLDGFTNLSAMSTLDLSHNFITGGISEAFLEAMPRLYSLDLSWNDLNGSIPVISNAALRKIDVSHNNLDGELIDQFDIFAANQDLGISSELDISDNAFCGPLPSIFYDLIMDAQYYIYSFSTEANHFRCEKAGNNEYFDTWAFGLSHDFGRCVPIPVISSVTNSDLIQPGDEVMLAGEFIETTRGWCLFTFEDRDEEVRAVYYSPSRVGCTLPDDAPIGTATVTVSHYCQDFASTETLSEFAEIEFQIELEKVEDGDVGTSSSKKTKVDKSVVAWAVAAAILALCAMAFIGFILKRERSGNPLFKPLQQTENPIHLEDDSNKGVDGIDLKVHDIYEGQRNL